MEPALRLQRVHGDNSVFEACCWVVIVVLLMGLAVGTALLVAPR